LRVVRTCSATFPVPDLLRPSNTDVYDNK